MHYLLFLLLFYSSETDGNNGVRISTSKSNSSKNDLLDLDFGNPVAQPPPPTRTAASSSMDPWGMPVQQEAAKQPPQLDPWGGVASAAATSAGVNNDPWSPAKEPPRASPNLAAGPSPNLGGPSPVNQPSKYHNQNDTIFYDSMTSRHFKYRIRRLSSKAV